MEQYTAQRGVEEGDARVTYQPRHAGAFASGAQPTRFLWAGLSHGASADGALFDGGRPVLRPLVNAATMPFDAYARSLGRFVADCPAWLRKFVAAKVADTLPVELPKSAGGQGAPGAGGGMMEGVAVQQAAQMGQPRPQAAFPQQMQFAGQPLAQR